MSAVTARSLSPAGVALLAVVVGGGLWAGTRATRGDDPYAGAADARRATLVGGPSAGLVALPVRTLDGAVGPLNGGGAPSVVMVSSETCSYCRAALREMGRVAAGRPLAGLRLVTLEGAEAGVPMLQVANVTGATLAGPATPSAEALWTFQIQGTPTFVALDARGRVVRTMVGYPGSERLRSWIGVMLGERSAP